MMFDVRCDEETKFFFHFSFVSSLVTPFLFTHTHSHMNIHSQTILPFFSPMDGYDDGVGDGLG
jgi:hypothetical protein